MRRGRPTAAEQYCDRGFAEGIKRNAPNKTTRTHATYFYCIVAFPLLSEAASEIPYLDRIFYRDDLSNTVRQKTEIIEQIGRMIAQDGYTEEDTLYFAGWAAKLYHDGYTVKQIKRALLEVRKAVREE